MCKCDDFVIVDFFIGMYKLIFKCLECDKISIIFDFFNNLTFFFFIENMWIRIIKFFLFNDVFV